MVFHTVQLPNSVAKLGTFESFDNLCCQQTPRRPWVSALGLDTGEKRLEWSLITASRKPIIYGSEMLRRVYEDSQSNQRFVTPYL